ncbi:uncharacterized protein TNCV_4747311 [Trichonephila clavipes]|nr:uncharacterized protein TNCV_4747311 [Trichonephila clavipes]
MIAASPLSPDEYAMRIATQTESALICKSTRPHSLSLEFRCSRHRRERLLRWAGVKRYTPYRASCKQTTTVQSSGHGKNAISVVQSPVVCLAISPAVCRMFLLACKTMYRSSAGVVPRGRPLLNPG